MWMQTIAIGNVGRDPEMRYTPDGYAVCDFTLAVNKRRGKGDAQQVETTWLKITLWRERAETASQYIKKGMKIMVIGEVKASAYMDKNGKPAASLELTANEFKFLDSKGDHADPQPSRQRQAQSGRGGGRNTADDPSDIPF